MAAEEVRAWCPRCGKVIHGGGTPYRPFCSQRCKLIDLGKWIEEEYRICGDKPTSEKKERVGEEGEGCKLFPEALLRYLSIPTLD